MYKPNLQDLKTIGFVKKSIGSCVYYEYNRIDEGCIEYDPKFNTFKLHIESTVIYMNINSTRTLKSFIKILTYNL